MIFSNSSSKLNSGEIKSNIDADIFIIEEKVSNSIQFSNIELLGNAIKASLKNKKDVILIKNIESLNSFNKETSHFYGNDSWIFINKALKNKFSANFLGKNLLVSSINLQLNSSLK